MYLFFVQGQICSVIDYEKTSNRDATLGDQGYAGIEPEVRLASDERQRIETLILAQVLDNETWVLSGLGRSNLNSSA
jgi:hypothetical protein